MIVRNLRPDECLPSELVTGFEAVRLSPEWVWVAEDGGKIVGAILGAAAHQFVFILRAVAVPDAPSSWMLRVLRRIAVDTMNRGHLCFLVFLQPEKEAERKLMEIAVKWKAYVRPMETVLVAGPLAGYIGGFPRAAEAI